MDHCLAQLFRVGLAPYLPKRDFVSRSVVFQNQRMVHGDIRHPLFKGAHRIAPRGHYIAQQLVRLRYRTGGAVDEARLDSAPGLYEALPVACRERPDVKGLDSLRTLFQPGFRMLPVAAFLHGASVFSAAELSAQSFSPALSAPKERGDACNDNYDERND
jgi:hypothetical protein